MTENVLLPNEKLDVLQQWVILGNCLLNWIMMYYLSADNLADNVRAIICEMG